MKARSRFSGWSLRATWSDAPDRTTRLRLLAGAVALAVCTGAASLTFSPPTSRVKLYVADRSFGRHGDRIAIYDRSARGNVAPRNTIAGGKTRLDYAAGIALDAERNVYVSSFARVTAYAPGASGDARPIEDLTGPATTLDVTGGVAVDANANIYVVNGTPRFTSEVAIFDAGANGNVPPARRILGPNTELSAPIGVAVDPAGNVYVTNTTYPPSITVYAAGASGDVKPTLQIAGPHTQLNEPTGIAVDANRDVYVTDHPSKSVLVYAAGASGDAAPARTIAGTKTTLTYPWGIALDARNRIYVTNIVAPKSVSVFAAGADGNVSPLRRLTGPRTQLDDPVGIALR